MLQHQHAPGQLTNLLRVAVEDSLDAPIRQVAAITVKNLVKADWDEQGETHTCRGTQTLLQEGIGQPARLLAASKHGRPRCSHALLRSNLQIALLGYHADEGKGSSLPEADRAAVRDNLVEGIVRAPPAVRSQLGECAKYVVHTDYPDHWPTLLPSIVAHLSTQVGVRSAGNA